MAAYPRRDNILSSTAITRAVVRVGTSRATADSGLVIGAGTGAEHDSVAEGVQLAPALRIDFAGIFRDHLLVYGWIFGLFRDVARGEIRHGDVVIDLMSLAVPVPRPD